MPRLDIDQKRAAYAFKSAEAGMKVGNYGSQIESLPMMIHNSGLRNALAFAYSKGYLKAEKGGADWKLVFDHITVWIKTEHADCLLILKDKTDPKEILKAIIDLKDYEYRFATQEAIALINWLRKFVKAKEKEAKK